MMKFDERGFVIYEMMPRYNNLEIPKGGQEKRRERRRNEQEQKKRNHFNP